MLIHTGCNHDCRSQQRSPAWSPYRQAGWSEGECRSRGYLLRANRLTLAPPFHAGRVKSMMRVVQDWSDNPARLFPDVNETDWNILVEANNHYTPEVLTWI